MSSSWNTKNLEFYFKELLNYVGLKDFEVTIHQLQELSADRKFRAILSYDATVEFPKQGEELIKALAKPLIEAVENSDSVKSVTKDYTKKIHELETVVQDLRQEIEKLKPFEQHYNLEMKLRHGTEAKSS